jgi:hypothetical protein
MIDRKLCASVSMFKGDSDRNTIKGSGRNRVMKRRANQGVTSRVVGGGQATLLAI